MPYLTSILKSLSCFPLAAALFLASPLPAVLAQSSSPASEASSGSELRRLTEISQRLSALNEQLRNELDGSRKSLAELQSTLGHSKEEISALKAELEASRLTSDALLNTAERSQMDLNGLRTALTKAGNSLQSLEQSFAAYRQMAELQIASLEQSRKRWRTGFFVASAVAVGGIVTGILGFTMAR
jgi:septal ring factor EnvC (AmiA/AmiB activator)